MKPLLEDDGSLALRFEFIDLKTNPIFKDCQSAYDVEDRFEEYWNRIRGGYSNAYIVKVVCVRQGRPRWLLDLLDTDITSGKTKKDNLKILSPNYRCECDIHAELDNEICQDS
jgi:hypothetical protein